MDAKKRRSAGQLVFVAAPSILATGCVLNQQKTAQITKDVATRETNFVLFVVFCSAL
jgi:hypothetical protein